MHADLCRRSTPAGLARLACRYSLRFQRRGGRRMRLPHLSTWRDHLPAGCPPRRALRRRAWGAGRRERASRPWTLDHALLPAAQLDGERGCTVRRTAHRGPDRGKPRRRRPSSLPALDSIAAIDPQTWRRVGLLILRDLELAIGAIDDLTIRDADRRLGAIVLRLAGARRADNPDDPEPEMPASQADLAAISGLSRATAAPILARLEAEGILVRGYRRIRLLQPHRLRSLVDADQRL